MGVHRISCLTLSGKINLPILLEPYIKRGTELKTAYRLLDEVPKLPQNSQQNLYLLDSLYLNTNIFKKIVHKLNSHLIVQSRNTAVWDVLKDGGLFFEQFKDDCKQMCS